MIGESGELIEVTSISELSDEEVKVYDFFS